MTFFEVFNINTDEAVFDALMDAEVESVNSGHRTQLLVDDISQP